MAPCASTCPCPDTPSPLRWTVPWLAHLGLLVLLVLLNGCVSTRYQRTPEKAPPAVPLELEASSEDLGAVLNTVVVFNGPGSWKRSAYWDEYQLTLYNPGTKPLTLENAYLTDMLGLDREPGTDPWALERASREQLAVYSSTGRGLAKGVVVMGTGVGMIAAALSGPLLTTSSGGAAVAVLGTGGLAFVLAPPAWYLGKSIRNSLARHDLEKEFQRRRLALPLTLAPGERRQGSCFFPVSPGPQRLVLQYGPDESSATLTLELAPLAGLHILRQPAPSTQARSQK